MIIAVADLSFAFASYGVVSEWVIWRRYEHNAGHRDRTQSSARSCGLIMAAVGAVLFILVLVHLLHASPR